MYSTFPDGLPGTGLVLLRAVCGALLIVQNTGYVVDWPSQGVVTLILALFAIASGVLLLIGCLTRFAAFAAAVACTSGIFLQMTRPGFDMFNAKLPNILAAAIAAAVICLGPGAFSLDALLFGRREVEIPRNPRASA